MVPCSASKAWSWLTSSVMPGVGPGVGPAHLLAVDDPAQLEQQGVTLALGLQVGQLGLSGLAGLLRLVGQLRGLGLHLVHQSHDVLLLRPSPCRHGRGPGLGPRAPVVTGERRLGVRVRH